jgi:DNA-binding CsgD family transcriptional regulator
MKRKKLSLLTLPEIELVRSQGNLTETQEKILLMLSSDNSDQSVMTSLYISNRRLYEDKKIIYEKARRLLGENNPLGEYKR